MNKNKKFILYTFKIENHFINHNKRLTNHLHKGEIKRKNMRKEVKNMKLVTAPLTWCDSTRGEVVKSEGGERGRERRRERQVADSSHSLFPV